MKFVSTYLILVQVDPLQLLTENGRLRGVVRSLRQENAFCEHIKRCLRG